MMITASDPKPQDNDVMLLILTGNYPIIADIVLTSWLMVVVVVFLLLLLFVFSAVSFNNAYHANNDDIMVDE